jgi:uncharacterized membrane protein HdeD (DUF308 family)
MDVLQKNRGLLIFEGIAFIILGILAIGLPVISTFATEQFLGWLLILGGLVQGYKTFQNHVGNHFYLFLFSAALNLILGVLLLMYPVAGVVSLALLLIFFFLMQGITKISMAYQLRPATNWGWLVVSGILSIVMAIIIWMGWPGSAFWAIGLLIGINMLFFGISLLSLGIALPKNKHTSKDN